jgi:hypothetical protein
MSIIPLHVQRRFEQRWAARFEFAGNPGCSKERRIERLAGQHAPRPEKAKEQPAGLSLKARENDRRQEKH